MLSRGHLALSQPLVLILLAATLVLLPIVFNAFGVSFLTVEFRRFLIVAIAAVSLDLILGYGGMVSLGHAAYFGLGAYAVGLLHVAVATQYWPAWITEPFVSWCVAALVSALAALF